MHTLDGEQLILVDENDRVIGHLDKESCHDGDGVRHRAFSVFFFDAAGRLLIQQRAAEKRLWPLFWSNSVCSHPRRGEELEVAAARRVRQELGIDATARYVYRFEYHEHFEDHGSEHEVCSVLVGLLDSNAVSSLSPAATEVAAVEWLAPDELDTRLARSPDSFTPWFKLEWRELRTEYADTVQRVVRGR